MTSTKFQNIQTKSEKNKLRREDFLPFLVKNSILLLLVISILFLQNTFAQNYIKWDLPEGAKMRLGKGLVGNLAFSADGNRLIVNSSIGIWIYDAKTGVELGFIAEHASDIRAVSPDASMYVSSDSDNVVHVRNLADGKGKVTLKGDTEDIRNITFSPDGKTLACSKKYEICLWDLTTGEPKSTLIGHTGTVVSVAFSPDGRTLASGSWDETLRLWDVDTATQIEIKKEHRDGIDPVVFSPDGKTLASTSFNERKIRLWDTATWEEKAAITTNGVRDMDFSVDSGTLATADSSGVNMYDVATGTLKTELTGHLSSWLSSIVFSPDGSTFASGGQDELHLWDAATGAQKLAISGHTSWVFGVAFAPDGRTLAAGGRYDIRLWDVVTGAHKVKLFENDPGSGNKSLSFSPDGSTLASEIGWRIRLWNVADGTHQATLKGFLGNRASGYGIVSLAFSSDGRYLASGSSDSTIQIWYVGRTYKGQLSGHRGGIWSIAFSNDSRTLASGSQDCTVRLWDVATGMHKDTFIGHTDDVRSVAFSPDGSHLASGSKDKTVILWDVATGEPIANLIGHPDGITCVAFSTDGRTLASASYRETVVRLWDVPTGMPKQTLIGHSSTVNNLVFSPDGNTLASGGSDGTILLWNMPLEIPQLAEDANRDGVVDIQDVIFIALQFGESGTENAADVNGDGVVDIVDILLVASALADENAAPSKHSRAIELLTTLEVQEWLKQAQQTNTKTPALQRGITVLEQFLAQLTPKKTSLLPNYPNPFNPETWIPYQLAKPADVTVRIYSSDGQLVRTLVLGNQPVGSYQSRNKAAYWDGKNDFGEPVASGIYFYTLSTGNFSATRRMVIQK